MAHHRIQEQDVLLNAFDIEFVECLAHMLDGGRSVFRMHTQLGDHRIVIKRDLAPFLNAGIVADLAPIFLGFRRRTVAHQPTESTVKSS